MREWDARAPHAKRARRTVAAAPAVPLADELVDAAPGPLDRLRDLLHFLNPVLDLIGFTIFLANLAYISAHLRD